jgi:hypothetical protein
MFEPVSFIISGVVWLERQRQVESQSLSIAFDAALHTPSGNVIVAELRLFNLNRLHFQEGGGAYFVQARVRC